MKRDIRINYSVLERISLNIKKYKTAIETIKEVLRFVNTKLEAENQGEAIEALKENYSELEGDLEGCQEELNDLYTIFDGYISEMQDIIRPVNSSSMMQVDRNDIWWNMESIFRACDEVGILKINVGAGMSLPNLFQSDEDKANSQKNSRMMEDIGDDIKYCYNRLNDNKDDLKNIYDKKVVPYENKDDEYSNKAGKLYFKYTNTWESNVEEGKDFGLTGINFGKGLVNLAGDVLKGGYGLAKGAVVIVGAGVAMKSMMETGDAPDCLKKCITETEGYGKTVSSVLKDPIIIAEGMAQSASDTVEEKGIAYSTSYVFGGVLLTKGLGKVSSVSKAGEAVDVEKNVLVKSKIKVGSSGEGIPLYEVKPRVLEQIYPDDTGVYGYLPKEGTPYDKYDFTDFEMAQKNHLIRQEYLDSSKIVEDKVITMKDSGLRNEEIARQVVDIRNKDKVIARMKMSPEDLAPIEARNLKLYGDKIGPTSEYLFADTKMKLIKRRLYKSDEQVWEQIIGKSMKKDDVMNTLLGIKH